MRNTISSLRILGFKKFEQFEITFLPGINILVGENEAGKSTILEAIRMLLLQTYRTSDKSILLELFTRKNVERFQKSPSIENLPRIEMEMELNLDSHSKNAQMFYGENYSTFHPGDSGKFGISFVCEFDRALGAEVVTEIQGGHIPVEYYSMKWTTFAGSSYQSLRKPLEFLAIDTTEGTPASAFNFFTRSLFMSACDEATRIKAKDKFRSVLKEGFGIIEMPKLSAGKTFCLDEKRVVFESILSVRDNGILLENKGRGMECLVKTQIALDKQGTNIDVVTLEEPENHLSYVNLRKMIHGISRKIEECQLIISTHSDMIVTRLGVKNLQWLTTNSKPVRFDNVGDDDAKFFMKTDNSNLLDFILASKTILVEGPTEYLLIPYFYEKETGRSLETDGVTVISCGGIRFRRYLQIATGLQTKVAVLTDNDGKQERIDKYRQFNDDNSYHHVFTGDSTSLKNWEECLFHENSAVLCEWINKGNRGKTPVSRDDVVPRMSENKVETAFRLLESGIELQTPRYVKEAIQWLNA